MDDDFYDEDGEEYQYKDSAYSGNYDLGIIHENPDDEEQ